jgi:hypothetical protein
LLLLILLLPALLTTMASLLACEVGTASIKSFSPVNWPRNSAEEISELLAGGLGSSGIIGW